MFTQNQLEILAALVTQPKKEYYMSELGNILGKHPGVFQRGLNSLDRHGYVVSRKQGNQRLFRINTDNPLFREVRNIVQKTRGVEALLKALVDRIDGITTALIYGSYPGDKMRPDSDIDLLVVRRNDEAEKLLLRSLGPIERKVQREINYKVYSAGEFRKRRRSHDPFLEEVLGGKYILLKGSI